MSQLETFLARDRDVLKEKIGTQIRASVATFLQRTVSTLSD